MASRVALWDKKGNNIIVLEIERERSDQIIANHGITTTPEKERLKLTLLFICCYFL
jgi:hypothetical protein